MPSQLLNRLDRFRDQQVALDVMALEALPRNDVLGPPPPVQDPAKPNKPAPNTRAHWPAGDWGAAITTVQSVVIQETSGWPSYASAGNFYDLYRCLNELAWNEPSKKKPGRRTHRRGIGPQYFVEPNGTARTLIGHVGYVGAGATPLWESALEWLDAQRFPRPADRPCSLE